MKKIFLFLFLFIGLQGFSQEVHKTSPFSASAELTSKYLWRGQEYGEAPTVFPTLGFATGGLSVYATGAYTIDNSWRETDLGVGYTIGDFSVGIVDYFYPTPTGNSDKLFNFKKDETGHLFEGSLSYAPSALPITAMVSTFFYGADKNMEGEQAWSAYAEIGYHYDFSETNILSLALGASLNKSLYNNFETGFSVVNIALKYQTAIPMGDYNLPVSAQYVINPQKEKSYLSFSVYLNI